MRLWKEKVAGVDTYFVETVVLGSGAAGLNAAALLKKGGEDDLLLVTEGMKCGTSRNTGSDKQTYYKLSLSGFDGDSVGAMAVDLYSGGCVDGDVAMVEASLSVPSFMRLVSLGVPFPSDRYGRFVGYKTDHDPRTRATSAGPYTSRFMTECLEKEVRAEGVEILDGAMAVRILTSGGAVRGIVVMDRRSAALSVILCRSLVLATGGPAGMYSESVYPIGHYGASGIAFEAGCPGRNLTEWQYGLASVSPRWNVSGSYMQVLPRFVSIDSEGKEYDFLSDYPWKHHEMLDMVFLKGYQWPFDVRKLEKGSSIVDVLCYLEKEKGRKVYLDFMHNPSLSPIPWDLLSRETREYLERAGATADTPLERLKALNAPAYDFYLGKGRDLGKEYLEIALCSQHNNGGLAMDSWWRSPVEGIFPVGEVAASHGVFRPGGSALNAGQCGSRRAAIWILAHRHGGWTPDDTGISDAVEATVRIAEEYYLGTLSAEAVMEEVQRSMSRDASAIRVKDDIAVLRERVEELLSSFSSIRVESKGRIWFLFQLRNILLEEKVYLSAMLDYMERNVGSRGSALYSDSSGQIHPAALDDRFTYSLSLPSSSSMIQEALLEKDGSVSLFWRERREIPREDEFFENVWRSYRENGNVI